jgi:hypothetical protein
MFHECAWPKIEAGVTGEFLPRARRSLRSETLTSEPVLRFEPVTLVQFGVGVGIGIGFSRLHFSMLIRFDDKSDTGMERGCARSVSRSIKSHALRLVCDTAALRKLKLSSNRIGMHFSIPITAHNANRASHPRPHWFLDRCCDRC